MKDFAHTGAASHGSCFSNARAAERPVAPEPDIEEESKKKRRISVAMAWPAAYTKHTRLIDPFSATMTAARDLMHKGQEDVTVFVDYLQDKGTSGAPGTQRTRGR